jgi:hypothetical protein
MEVINMLNPRKALGWTVLSVFLMTSSAIAQQAATEVPRAEVFGGFSFMRFGISNGTNLSGWQASSDINLNRHLGIVADFGGQYKTVLGTTASLYEYMTGPQFNFRTKRVTAFAHGLVGGASIHALSTTLGAFGVGVGGGLDINLNQRIAIRAFQLDSIHDRRSGVWAHSLRAGVGLVVKLGKV